MRIKKIQVDFMTNYSIAQIKSLGQPPEVLNRRVAEHWSGPLYMRKISPYLSKVLLSLGFSPTVVTWLMVLSGWLAAASVIKTGLIGAILAVFFAQLQMLFDCSDGEMARVSQKFNPAGIFIDRFGHYSTEALIAIAFCNAAIEFSGRSNSFQAPLWAIIFVSCAFICCSIQKVARVINIFFMYTILIAVMPLPR